MTTWPSHLPKPAIGTFREQPPQNSIRSDMDKGPAKVRRRTTANIRAISFTLRLSPAQTEILDTFFVTTTASGSLSFDFEHPRTKQTVEARFASEPSYQEFGGVKYDCGIQLEILP
jgi:hypothetical protein